MANYAILKAAIAAAIKENGNNEITGNLLQQQLLAMVNSLGAGYQFAGIATPATNPGTPDQNVYYLAYQMGEYTNFGATIEEGQIGVFAYNGNWNNNIISSSNIALVNGFYRNTSGSTLATQLVAANDYKTILLPVKTGDSFRVISRAGALAGNWATYDENGIRKRVQNAGTFINQIVTIEDGETQFVYNANGNFEWALYYLNGVINEFLISRAEPNKIPDFPVPEIIAKGSLNYTDGQSLILFNNLLSLTDNAEAYIKISGVASGKIQCLSSAYLVVANIEFNEDGIAHLLIPNNAKHIQVIRDITTGSGTATIEVGKNTGITPIYQNIRILGNRIGDGVELVNVTERRLTYRIKGPFKIKVNSGFAVYYIVRENELDIREGNTNLVAIQDYNRTTFEMEDGGTFLLDFAKQDNSAINITENIIAELTSGPNGLRHFFHKNNVSPQFAISQLDFRYFNLRYGSIDNAGVITNGPHVYSELIPICPLSVIDIAIVNFTPGDDYFRRVFAWFYYVDENGNETYISNINTTNAALHFIGRVPSNANAVRFMFTKWQNGQWQQLDITQIGYNYKVIAKTADIFNDPDFEIKNADTKPIFFNNENDWIQGRAISGTNPGENSVSTAMPVKVTPGHKYLFLWNPIYDTDKLLWTIRLEMLQTIDGVSTGSGQIYRAEPTFTIPFGINYIRIVAEGAYNTTPITPAMAALQNFQIYDITANYYSLPSATKIIPITYATTRYAQAMVIKDGYIFQTFSNGTLEIYSTDSLQLLQTLELPKVQGTITPHCNNIQFGDYYQSGDPFPLLYVSADNINGVIMAIRFVGTMGELVVSNVAEIPTPTLDASTYIAPTQIIDFANKKMVQYSYEIESQYTGNLNGYNNVHIQVCSFDNLNANIAYTVEYVATVPRIFPLQAGKMVDGRCYIVYGGGTQMKSILIFNIYTGKIEKFIDLTNNIFGIVGEEPQAIDEYRGKHYLSTVRGIYEFIV